MPVSAMYPGTFDPITLGHEDLVRRAARLFDTVVVAIALDTGGKQPMFSFDERVAMAEDALAEYENVEIRGYSGLTVEYARERILFGKPLSKMQVTQFKLVELMTDITAARELTHSCVRKRVAGEDATLEISMAKLVCGRLARKVADECIQLHGGYGYMKESPAGRGYVDLRLISIGGGSDETMLHYLAKQLGFQSGRCADGELPMTMGTMGSARDLLAERAHVTPEKPAVIDDRPDGYLRIYSFREFNEMTNRVANGLVELGFGGATTFRATCEVAKEHGVTLEFYSIDRAPPPAELFSDGDDAELIAAALIDGHAQDGGVTLTIATSDWRDAMLPNRYFDAVYHDPFVPQVTPECWSSECFRWSLAALKPMGRLVTWGAATASRQAMRDAGYVVARAPGAGRKRESTVAAPQASALAGLELWRPA